MVVSNIIIIIICENCEVYVCFYGVYNFLKTRHFSLDAQQRDNEVEPVIGTGHNNGCSKIAF